MILLLLKLSSPSRIKFNIGVVGKNIGWGVFSNLFQNIFYSIFFIVVARKYETLEFSKYIIANNLYGLVLSFSSLGLGQWFLREIQNENDHKALYYKYLKIQLSLGILFYIICIAMCILIYKNDIVLKLALILGLNIILDNILSVFKFMNIHTSRQYNTFLFLSGEAMLKFVTAMILLLYELSMIKLVIITVGIKLLVAVLFFYRGLPIQISTRKLIEMKVTSKEVYRVIIDNISFAIIGTMSVLFWGISNIIVSKYLTIRDIAHYDIVFKIFSMAQIIPVIFSITIFPLLVKSAQKNNDELKLIVSKYYLLYLIYGITSYVAVYSYIDLVVPIVFGFRYTESVIYCKEMFLTMSIFPIVLLQANLLISIKKEKIDMWMNIGVLLLNSAISLSGIYYYKSLSTINYSIFISFLLFLVMQDIYIAKLKLKNKREISYQYLIIGCVITFCYILNKYISIYYIFPAYIITLLIFLLVQRKYSGILNPVFLNIEKTVNN